MYDGLANHIHIFSERPNMANSWEENGKYILSALEEIKQQLVRVENRIDDKAIQIYTKIDAIADRCDQRAEANSNAIKELGNGRIHGLEMKAAATEGSKSAIAAFFSTVLSIIAIAITWFAR